MNQEEKRVYDVVAGLSPHGVSSHELSNHFRQPPDAILRILRRLMSRGLVSHREDLSGLWFARDVQ